MENQKAAVSPAARFSFLLGCLSLISLMAAVLLAFFIESLGMVDLFGIVSAFALVAIVLGFIARQKNDRSRLGLAGLILGVVTLFGVLFFRFVVFIFFLPWLFA